MSHRRVTTSGLGSCCLVFWVFFFFFSFSNVASNVLHQTMKNAVRMASELSPQWD